MGELDSELLQRHYISKPVPLKDILALLERHWMPLAAQGNGFASTDADK